MGCGNCGSCGTGSNGAPAGCGDKGHCSTGGCNKLNTFDWLSHIDLPEQGGMDAVEVGFKNNARKEFFRKPHYLQLHTGDYVVVESTAGSFDIGRVSIAGELVRMQMKKKRVRENATMPNILRLANERDVERLQEARALEKDTLIRARAIARSMDLDMKVGDVEFQGDKRKVTFYYTADGRVDFRELIRIYAKEFKVKIEMRQIGARQESARIGGIGACGRELCCSTWLGDFRSVSTVAARYQNLAINQAKLSGQCGRLKCCLNFELKSYLDALRDFPKNVDKLQTQRGTVILIKTDIFKRLMYYGYQQQYGMADIQPLTTVQVKQLQAWNAQGIVPNDLTALKADENGDFGTPEQDSSSIAKAQRTSRLHRKINKDETNTLELDEPLQLPDLDKKKRKNNKKPNNNSSKPREERTGAPLHQPTNTTTPNGAETEQKTVHNSPPQQQQQGQTPLIQPRKQPQHTPNPNRRQQPPPNQYGQGLPPQQGTNNEQQQRPQQQRPPQHQQRPPKAQHTHNPNNPNPNRRQPPPHQQGTPPQDGQPPQEPLIPPRRHPQHQNNPNKKKNNPQQPRPNDRQTPPPPPPPSAD